MPYQGTHFQGLVMQLNGLFMILNGLWKMFPGVGINGVKWKGSSGALRSPAAVTDAGALPVIPLSACAAPAPATLRPARAAPSVTTFQVAGRSMMSSCLLCSSLRFISVLYCTVTHDVNLSNADMGLLSSRTCQPRHRKLKDYDGVLGPLMLLQAKRPSRQSEQRGSGSLS